jgi:DNA polymerase
VGRGFVPAIGPLSATLAFVGQGPGEEEAWAGTPFVGPSGRTLSRWQARAGIDRAECYISNVVWCWLPGNRAPTAGEVAHCKAAHWGPGLQRLPSLRVVIPVGIPAAKALVDPAANKNWAGRVVEIEL